MNCKSFSIEYMPVDRLMTEIRFDIASARSLGFEILRFEPVAEDVKTLDKLRASVVLRLRALKKEGVIQFFASEHDFKNDSTEAVYLLNKYPELAVDAALAKDDALESIIVRL